MSSRKSLITLLFQKYLGNITHFIPLDKLWDNVAKILFGLA